MTETLTPAGTALEPVRPFVSVGADESDILAQWREDILTRRAAHKADAANLRTEGRLYACRAALVMTNGDVMDGARWAQFVAYCKDDHAVLGVSPASVAPTVSAVRRVLHHFATGGTVAEVMTQLNDAVSASGWAAVVKSTPTMNTGRGRPSSDSTPDDSTPDDSTPRDLIKAVELWTTTGDNAASLLLHAASMVDRAAYLMGRDGVSDDARAAWKTLAQSVHECIDAADPRTRASK